MKQTIAVLLSIAGSLLYAGDTYPVTVGGDGYSASPTFSANGRYIVFVTTSTNLAPDLNGKSQVVVKDLQTGVYSLVSYTANGLPDPNGASGGDLMVSDDGRFVVFSSSSQLAPGDLNSFYDVYLRDRQLGTTQLISHNAAGYAGNNISFWPTMSADGRFIAFQTGAQDIVPLTSNSYKVVLYDRITSLFELVSVSTSGTPAAGHSGYPSITPDGRFVVFASVSPLVANDHNGRNDVYLRDRLSETTSAVSISSAGLFGNNDSGGYYHAAVSADGRFVAFQTDSTNLVGGDTNRTTDILLRDTVAGTTVRATVSNSGLQANNSSSFPRVSDDGRFVAFMSAATNLVPGDTNAGTDVFVRDLETNSTERVSVGAHGVQAEAMAGGLSLSPDGSRCAFASADPNLAPGDANGAYDIFVRVFSRDSAELSGVLQLTGATKPYGKPVYFRVLIDGEHYDPQVNLGPAGEFSFVLPRKAVELSAKAGPWLRKTLLVDLRGGDQVGVVMACIAGDATGDNVVDLGDVSAVLLGWGGAAADLNLDSVADLFDLSITLTNFGLAGDS